MARSIGKAGICPPVFKVAPLQMGDRDLCKFFSGLVSGQGYMVCFQCRKFLGEAIIYSDVIKTAKVN